MTLNNQSNDSELTKRVSNLIDGDYACNRVWEAWQVNTMTEDDFVPLNETERVDEIVQFIQDKILKARIEELSGIDWKTGDGGYYFVKDRISVLQSQLTKNQPLA